MRFYRNFIATSLASILLVGCGVESDKEDVAEIPFGGDYDGKADSWAYPVDGGTILVGQAAVGDFTETTGWIGYEVELKAGPVDVDLHDANGGSDSDLDTLLLVYGPKRADGSYPYYPAAINDDVVPGENLNSHILFDVPEDGTYRVVASTYLNWVYWPYNASTGSYQLVLKCPRIDAEGPLACGPHEGYVDEWVAMSPTRGTNPWDPDAEDELTAITEYYASLGVEVKELGLVLPEFVMPLCPELFCWRGDRLVMRVPADDAQLLLDEHGFTLARDVASPWYSYAPIQCGNPWEPVVGDQREDVKAWAADNGVALGEVGFVRKTVLEPVCLACPCARGDRLIVTPAEASADPDAPLALGFARL